MLHVNEIRVGEVLRSNWVQYVYSKPLWVFRGFGYDTYNEPENDSDGRVMVTAVYPTCVVAVGRSGRSYYFDTMTGYVKLRREVK